MEPYQQRVVAERDELQARFDRLFAFTGSSMFRELPDEEQDLLHHQANHMAAYLDVLRQRIALWPQYPAVL